MADIEKVLEGLKCHKSGYCSITKKTCPYWLESDYIKKLCSDASAMLKAEMNRVIEQIESDIQRTVNGMTQDMTQETINIQITGEELEKIIEYQKKCGAETIQRAIIEAIIYGKKGDDE